MANSIQHCPTKDLYREMNARAGAVLCQLRESRHESQLQLAVVLGITQDIVSKWEAGKRPVRYAEWKAIAAHYHKDLKALLLSIAAPATLWDIAKHELKDKS